MRRASSTLARRALLAATLATVALAGCSTRDTEDHPMTAASTSFRLASSAFRDGESIPAVHTCDGQNLSPPLTWSGAPAGTVSYALIMDDPDAPVGTWDHWLLWNVKGRELPAGSDGGGVSGTNSWGRTGYGGPCPPSGTHHYGFRLLALDTVLDLPTSTRKAGLLAATKGHVLGEARLVGLYARK